MAEGARKPGAMAAQETGGIVLDKTQTVSLTHLLDPVKGQGKAEVVHRQEHLGPAIYTALQVGHVGFQAGQGVVEAHLDMQCPEGLCSRITNIGGEQGVVPWAAAEELEAVKQRPATAAI